MASTRHLVDPELLPALDAAPPSQLSGATLSGLRAARAAALEQELLLEPDVPNVDVAERSIAGPDGAPNVRVLLYTPAHAERSRPALLWIHGGGYVMGTPEADGFKMKSLAAEVGCVVISVDYRLAPEAPYPAGVEDCYAALRWTHAQAEGLGVDRERVAIGGSSAGGGLAAALALLARDRGELKVAFQLLLVPMLDDRTVVADDPHPFTGEFTWTTSHNLFGWTALLGQTPGGADVSPYAAPARADSLAGLPPSYVATGALDLFLEENLEYARRLARAGVPMELHVYPGAYHGFSRTADARVSKAYVRDHTQALQRAFESRPARVPVSA
ncbi:MAG: alpha/beta hydrolase [Chloroflexi bacterium]|nr:alpha/beta hydrolase [Chloroflexota bacterium]